MFYARHVDLSDEAVKHDYMVRKIYPLFYATLLQVMLNFGKKTF